MIDPKLLRQSAADVAANLARRGFVFDAEAYLALDERRKSLQIETEALRNERNTSAKSIGKAKAQGENIEPLLAAVKDLGERLEASDASLQEVQDQLSEIELGLPNLLIMPKCGAGVSQRTWASGRVTISSSESHSVSWTSMRQAVFRGHGLPL